MANSPDNPLLSVVMVDGGWRENFDPLASWLDQSLPAERYELIWVDYTDRVAPQVEATGRVRTFALGRRDEPQVLPRAYNEGIRQARGGILVLPDADVYCQRDLLATVAEELTADPSEVLYVLRLDQTKRRYRPGQDADHVRATATLRHTHNFGGCVAVAREHLLAINGYEELPFFAGYLQSGFDNWVRFKNLGLKIRWHPTQRVYHPWHPTPPAGKFDNRRAQKRLIARRAATGEVLAYQGLDAARNRPYDPDAPLPTDWPNVMTERGLYRHEEGEVFEARPAASGPVRRLWRRLRGRGGRRD